MTTLIEAYRYALLGTSAPSLGALVAVTGFSFAVAVGGFLSSAGSSRTSRITFERGA
jgi:hypothetical protein